MRISCLALLLLFATVVMAQETDVVVEKYQDLSDKMVIYDMVVDENNGKWLATDIGLLRIASIKTKPQVIDKAVAYFAVAKDAKGNIWGGTQNNAITNEDGGTEYILQGTDLKITCMAFHRSILYIGTNQGLYTYNPRLDKESKTITKKNSRLPSDQINMLLADSRDQLWVGTDEGLAKIKKGKIKEVNERKHKFWAATETKEGIWVVSDKEMWLLDFLESDKFERWRPAALRRGLSKGQVRALTSDSNGKLYLASETLVQFDPYTDKTLLIDQDYGFVSTDALALLCDRNDDLWIGTGDHGMFRIDIVEGEAEELTAVVYVKEELLCSGKTDGTIGLKVNGGKEPYTIRWNTMTGDLGQMTLENLPAGTYTATVVDGDQNKYVASTDLIEPDPLAATEVSHTNISNLKARDGALEVRISGGTPPYRLRWNNGKRDVTQIENLKYGEQELTIVDANRCEKEEIFFIGKPKVLAQLDITKVQVGQTLRIEQLYFTADSSAVEEDSYPVLDEIYDFLALNNNVVIEIGGHTNGIPPHDYCDKLSESRAKNVAKYLYTKGIPVRQVSYKGYGKRKPIATNKSKQGRQRNQRVELKIVDIVEG